MKIKRFSKVEIGTFLLAISSILSRGLGIVRDAFFAKYFGTGTDSQLIYDINTYFAAFKVPDLVYTLLVFGALSAAFIPIYTKLKKKDHSSAQLFANQILNQVLFLLLIGSLIIFAAAPFLLKLLLPGFDSEQLKLTVELTRIMLLSPIFFTLSSVFQGIENSHKKFLGIALAPIMYNLGIIAATYFYSEDFGVYALAWGAVVGSFLHFAVQVPGAFRAGYRYFWAWDFKAKPVRQFISLSGPRILGLSLSQFSVMIDTFLASVIGSGALAIYTYSSNLESLAYGVVGISLSIAVFSTLSEHADHNDSSAFVATIQKSIDTLLFWTLPSIVGIYFLSEEIIELILLRGAFSMEDLALTSTTIKIFIWAALGQSIIPLLARAFYSLENTKTPVLIALFSVLMGLLNSLILILHFELGVWALAISAVLASNLNALLLLFFLSKDLKTPVRQFFSNKNLICSLGFTSMMGLLLYALKQQDISNVLIELGVSCLACAALYLGLHQITRTNPHLHKK